MVPPVYKDPSKSVEFSLLWKGNTEPGHDCQLSYVDIFMKNTTGTIGAAIKTATSRFERQELLFQIQEDTTDLFGLLGAITTGSSILASPETAKTMAFSIRLFSFYEDKATATMDRAGVISYPTRARRKDIAVTILNPPEFKAGEHYTITLQPNPSPLEIEATFQLNPAEAYGEERELQLADLISELQEQCRIYEESEAGTLPLDKQIEKSLDLLVPKWLEQSSPEQIRSLHREITESIDSKQFLDLPGGSLVLALAPLIAGIDQIASQGDELAEVWAALEQGEFSDALAKAEALANESSRCFAFLVVAEVCIMEEQLKVAKEALDSLPAHTEGKLELITAYQTSFIQSERS